MENSLSKKVTFFSLIKYTLPTIIMMLFFSLYTIIDGMFVSRFIGSNALSAINITYPIIAIFLSLSIMLATGGSAIVAKLMGEGKNDKACEGFTLINLTAIIIGILIAIPALLFIKPLINLLGSTEILYDYCKDYLSIFLICAPLLILKSLFDYFFVTAGKPTLGLVCSILGGLTNILLDYIFIAKLQLGISGAALATCIGYSITAIIGVLYFFRKHSFLHFKKTSFDGKLIINCCSNGFSEMVTQLSSAIMTFAYNLLMLKYLGEDGVAAITIILYLEMLLFSAYIGFTSGVSPRISYNYGAKDIIKIKKIIKYSYIHILILSIVSFISIEFFGDTLLILFSGKDSNVYLITSLGLKLFSISFLFSGFNTFTTGMFTAFSNGKVSALLSFFRTFVFFILGILTLPLLLNITGIWLIAPFYEFISLIMSLAFFLKYRKTYQYI